MVEEKISQRVFRCPWYFLAFGYGTGLSPIAPGTMGTLVGLGYFLLLSPLSGWAYASVIVVMTLFGCWVCGYVSNSLGVHDHSGIVWDEIVGMLITLWGFPPSFEYMVAGFFFFRLFDIVKPFPIAYIDKHIQGGTGIMMDDVLAAIPAWCCLYVLSGVFSG